MPEKRVEIGGVTNGNCSASYSYLANSPLVEQISWKDTGTTRIITTKSYDSLNRLTAIFLASGDSPDQQACLSLQRCPSAHARDAGPWLLLDLQVRLSNKELTQ